MELVIVILMIVGGIALAGAVIGALAVASSRDEVGVAARGAPERDRLGASLLVQLLLLGRQTKDEACRLVREAGLASPVTDGIDVASWAEAFHQVSDAAQREWLLETAVRLVAQSGPVPLSQYSALLDLNFALGFQTSALARLRERHNFAYADYAGARGDAERKPMFERSNPDLLRVLELDGKASRAAIVTAYRRLAARHHPDRFHDAPSTVREEAAGKFIEITRAYEILLTLYRD